MQLNKSSSVLDGSDVLRSVFESPDDEMETFFDALQGAMGDEGGEPSGSATRKIVAGKPDQVQVQAKQTEEVSGFIRILRGWHGQDYVWRIEPAAIRRSWRVSIDRVLYAVAQTMNKVVPKNIEVKIWLPKSDWELKAITFKAMGLSEEWSVTQEDLEKLSTALFEVLNPLV